MYPISFSQQPPSQGLSSQQLAELAEAKTRYKRVRGVLTTSTGDAWITGFFAAASLLLCLLDFSWPGLFISLVMLAIAINAFRGSSRLRKLDPAAARLLAFNQLALATGLIIYAIWQLINYTFGPPPFADAPPEVRDMLKDYQPLVRLLVRLIYAGLILVALLGQGSMSLYYFSRAKRLEKYQARIPAWILQMQQAGFRL